MAYVYIWTVLRWYCCSQHKHIQDYTTMTGLNVVAMLYGHCCIIIIAIYIYIMFMQTHETRMPSLNEQCQVVTGMSS
jgi:hypothetical protein